MARNLYWGSFAVFDFRLIIILSNSFLIGRKRAVNFRNQRP